jgi:hypothetical protein
MTHCDQAFNTPVAPVLPSDLRNAQEHPKSRHFCIFPSVPSSDLPSQDTRLDRALAAFDALVCCKRHQRIWMRWILSGRFGPDFPAALERLAVELALQHGEVRP